MARMNYLLADAIVGLSLPSLSQCDDNDDVIHPCRGQELAPGSQRVHTERHGGGSWSRIVTLSARAAAGATNGDDPERNNSRIWANYIELQSPSHLYMVKKFSGVFVGSLVVFTPVMGSLVYGSANHTYLMYDWSPPTSASGTKAVMTLHDFNRLAPQGKYGGHGRVQRQIHNIPRGFVVVLSTEWFDHP